MSRVCVITWVFFKVKIEHERTCTKWKHKIAVNIVIFQRWQIWCTPNTIKPTHQKNHNKPRHLDVSGLWAGTFSEIAKTAIKWLRRIKNMYKSEHYFVSMPKKHIFLQKGSSTLDDISLQNVIAHPAEFFFVFWCSITTSWAYKKPQKRQTRWSYKMTWHLKTLTKWTLENLQLCLLGALLQNALVRGIIVTTKCLYINHL